MLKKAVILLLVLGCMVLTTSGTSSALGLGGLSYNIGPSFSIGAGVGFSMRDTYVIKNDDFTDEMSSSRFLIKADVAPIPYVDIYGLFGASDLRMDNAPFEGILGTAWGVGLRPQVFPLTFMKSPFKVALDGQYAELRTRDNDIHARLSEIQVSAIVSYVMKSLAPYGGIKYDHTTVHFSGSDNDIVGDMDWGAFIGCDYFVTPNVFFNLELSIFAETAFYLSTGYKF